MSDWQSIERAPKDGTRILGWDGDHIAVTSFGDLRGWEDESQATDDGYGWVGHDTWQPTLWMPLPLPPD